MKRLILITGLLLAPAGGWAQGLPVDFDPESAAEAHQAARPAADRRDAVAEPRAVRYAEGSVRMVNGTSPMAADLDMTRLPGALVTSRPYP